MAFVELSDVVFEVDVMKLWVMGYGLWVMGYGFEKKMIGKKFNR